MLLKYICIYIYIFFLKVKSFQSHCNDLECHKLCREIYSWNVLNLDFIIGACDQKNFCFCFKKLKPVIIDNLENNYLCTDWCQIQSINSFDSKCIERNSRIHGLKINDTYCDCFYRFNQ